MSGPGTFAMSKVAVGMIGGAAMGLVMAGALVRVPDREKRSKMMVLLFIKGFTPGFCIGSAFLPLPQWLTGAIFGILMGLPQSIVLKKSLPAVMSMSMDIVSGVLIGTAVQTFGK